MQHSIDFENFWDTCLILFTKKLTCNGRLRYGRERALQGVRCENALSLRKSCVFPDLEVLAQRGDGVLGLALGLLKLRAERVDAAAVLGPGPLGLGRHGRADAPEALREAVLDVRCLGLDLAAETIRKCGSRAAIVSELLK